MNVAQTVACPSFCSIMFVSVNSEYRSSLNLYLWNPQSIFLNEIFQVKGKSQEFLCPLHSTFNIVDGQSKYAQMPPSQCQSGILDISHTRPDLNNLKKYTKVSISTQLKNYDKKHIFMHQLQRIIHTRCQLKQYLCAQ